MSENEDVIDADKINAECRRLLKEAVYMQIIDFIGPEYSTWADEVEAVVEAVRKLEWEARS